MIWCDFRSSDHASREHFLGYAGRRNRRRGDSLGGLRVSITALKR
jgi:hypothetical protein